MNLRGVVTVDWTYWLTAPEVEHCEALATQIITFHNGRGSNEVNDPNPATRWERNANGSAAEITLARLCGYDDWLPPFERSYPRKRGDLPNGIEVRWSSWRSLKFYHPYPRRRYDKTDDPDLTGALVTGQRYATMKARGWLLAKEAQQEKYLGGAPGRPREYFVDVSELHPVSTLAGAACPHCSGPIGVCRGQHVVALRFGF